MGRYYWSSRREADGLQKIQIWWLKKHDYLNGGFRFGGIKWTSGWSGSESSVSFRVSTIDFENYLRLMYSKKKDDGSKQSFNYKIPLTTTPCYFGGKRYWFICPWYANKIYCGRRVGVLYLDGDYFACRNCYDLTYRSRNEGKGKYTLMFGPLFKAEEISEKISKLRVKFWLGRPTKRYRKLVTKESQASGKLYLASSLMQELNKK